MTSSLFLLFFLTILTSCPLSSSLYLLNFADYDFTRGDYSPPSPPPPSPPPHPPSATCHGGLHGVGSLDTICKLNISLNFTSDVFIEGNGTLEIQNDVVLRCPVPGCSILINMTKNFKLGQMSAIIAGTVSITAHNVTLTPKSLVNSTGLGGEPPARTSGTPSGVQGSGGGHGGRGASCVTDNTKLPDDVWGGDAYSWSELDEPWSYGSKGGSTSKEESFGGEGGGRIGVVAVDCVEVDGSLAADGGYGGLKGGGGSGGSVFIKAHRM